MLETPRTFAPYIQTDMGEIMAYIHTGRTVREWAQLSGKDEQTVMAQLRRRKMKGMSLDSVLSDEQWAQVYGDKARTSAQNKSVSIERPAAAKELPSGKTKESGGWRLPDLSTVRRFLLDCILVGIVIGHAGLIWYDCADLWDVPGQIGGGLAFFIIVAAVMLSTDPTKNITSQIALLFAFLVDVGAYWVHFPVFQNYSVDDVITRVLCGFLCLMSFGALLIYRHQKNN